MRKRGVNAPLWQTVLHICAWAVVLLVMAPFLVTLWFSLKGADDFNRGLWTLPRVPRFNNYWVCLQAVNFNMLNSVCICLVIAVAAVLVSSLAAYTFARYDFKFKNALFGLIIALMMVPGILTLTPQYLNILSLGLHNTRFAVILPGIAGNVVGCVFLFRTFMGQQPGELYESARVEGAGDLTMYFRIALPLSVPVLMIQLVGIFAMQYNDYLWPMLVVEKPAIQMLMPLLKDMIADVYAKTANAGATYALYIVSGIPLVVTSLIGLKYFVNGDFASGLKF
jgi:ABC-type glycerol-3-phosphate transport system permease component